MIVVTTPTVPGSSVTEALGLVRGSSIRSRHLGRDIIAQLRNVAGGEIHEYTKMLAEAREQAVDRMIEEAQMLGADAVISVRFQTSMVVSGAAEQFICPAGADQNVVALAPIKGVIPLAPIQNVITGTGINNVIPQAGINIVGTPASINGFVIFRGGLIQPLNHIRGDLCIVDLTATARGRG